MEELDGVRGLLCWEEADDRGSLLALLRCGWAREEDEEGRVILRSGRVVDTSRKGGRVYSHEAETRRELETERN